MPMKLSEREQHRLKENEKKKRTMKSGECFWGWYFGRDRFEDSDVINAREAEVWKGEDA